MSPSYRKRIYRRAKGILWGPIEGIAAVIGGFLFLYRPLMSALQRFWEGTPWWVGLLILCSLLLYAFIRATYQEYKEVEQQRDALQKRVEELEAQPRPRQAGELRARCIHLGRDVRAFQYDQGGFTGNPTDEEVCRREEETVCTYRAQYRPAIMTLYGELAPNWFHGGDRELFENLSEWSQLQDVAERLETVGERLPES